MFESGLLQKWTNDLLRETDGCTSAYTNAQTLTLKDIAGCFIILGVGLTLSAVVLVVELLQSCQHVSKWPYHYGFRP